jgi:hypothetical protein
MRTPSDHAFIGESLEKLRLYVEKENFRGYDPYDTLKSFFPFRIFGRMIPILALQFQKRNPVNIRPLLGVRKDYNPKALGLFLQAYCKLQGHDRNKNYSEQIEFLYASLKANYTRGFSGYCWGYNFDWASAGKYIRAGSPNIVVTAFVAKGLIAYYQLKKDEDTLRILRSIGEFILNDLPRTDENGLLCFSYTTLEADHCYNASLLAAEVLAGLHSITGEAQYRDLAIRAGNFVIARQYDDGHWNYSYDALSGRERVQIDFHQGYVIDSLKIISQICCPGDVRYQHAIEKGLEFYRREQFFESGQSKWRLPKIYPVEIHNQAQGIITFAHEKSHLSFADTIARWTIANMQDKKGYFYYRKLKRYTNKISYMRWSQAWMFVALTDLQIALQKDS